MLTRDELEAKLIAEIERFGLEDTETNVHGLVAYFDDDLPPGWVRIDGDGSGPEYGPADKLLAALADQEETGDWDDDQGAFFEAIREAWGDGEKPNGGFAMNFRTMTPDALGQDAEENDVAFFRALCEAAQELDPSLDDLQATRAIWFAPRGEGEGDYVGNARRLGIDVDTLLSQFYAD